MSKAGFYVIVFFAALLMASFAVAQTSLNSQNNPVALGKSLTSLMVAEELERIMQLAPKSDVSLWNAGYDFFRRYPHNQDTANAIKNGFLRARGTTAEQKDILLKAAIYWEKIHDYGITNVPVGIDDSTRNNSYYGQRRGKQSTLGIRKSGSKHNGYKTYNNPGRYIDKQAPYRGRPDNPYPGKYYPGVYPP